MKELDIISFSRTKSILPSLPMLCTAILFVLGMLCCDALVMVSLRMWCAIALLMLVVALLTYRHRQLLSDVAVLVFIIAAGAVRMAWCRHSSIGITEREEVTTSAVVATSPTGRRATLCFEALIPSSSPSFPERRVMLFLPRDARSAALSVGDGLTLRGILRPLSVSTPDRFHSLQQLQSHGVVAMAYIPAAHWHGVPSEELFGNLSVWNSIRLRLIMFRDEISHRLYATGMDRDAFAVASAMTLGYKAFLTPELREDYALSGASHVLALSGMHLTILFLMLTFFTPRMRCRVFGIFAVVWVYVIFTGMSPSLLRSAVLMTLWSVLRYIGRRQLALNVLGALLLFFAILTPLTLWSVSFQLSFLAVFSIAMYSSRITLLVNGPYNPDGKYSQTYMLLWHIRYRLWQATSVAIAAQIATLPLSMYYFGNVPLLFFVTNLVVAPFAYAIVCTTLFLALVVYLSSLFAVFYPLAELLATILTFVVNVQNSILSYISSLPCSSLTGVSLSFFELCLIYILICGLTVAGICLISYKKDNIEPWY